MVLGAVSAHQSSTTLTVNVTTAYAGSASAAPVEAIITTVSVPSSRLVAGTPAASAGWTYVGPVRINGGWSEFDFQWSGTLASGAAAAPLVVQIAKADSRTHFDVSVASVGASLHRPVATAPATASVGPYATLGWEWGPQTQTLGEHDSAASGNPWVTDRIQEFRGAVTHGSPELSAPVVGLTALVSVPSSHVRPGNGVVRSGPWGFVGRRDQTGTTVFEFAYTGGAAGSTGTLAPGSSAQFTWQVPRRPGQAGSPYTVTVQGPSPSASGAVAALTHQF